MKNKVLMVVLILAAVGVLFFLVRGPHSEVSVEDSHSTSVSVTLPVKGMTCASCQETVREGLLKLPGVLAVDVSLADETARIKYDRDRLIVQSLVETIENMGYESQVPTENQLQVIDFKMKIN